MLVLYYFLNLRVFHKAFNDLNVLCNFSQSRDSSVGFYISTERICSQFLTGSVLNLSETYLSFLFMRSALLILRICGIYSITIYNATP